MTTKEATTTLAAAGAGGVALAGHHVTVPVRACKPHPRNPRPEITDDSVRSLADNIAAVGLLNRPIVRSTGEGKYEVLAGHRRIVAARVLGWADVPVMLVECDDATAVAVVLADNMDREESDLLLESQTVVALLKGAKGMPGLSVQQVADKLGKTRRWVMQREAVARLDPQVQKMLRKPDDKGGLASWSPAMVETLALIEPSQQRSFLEEQCGRYAHDEHDLAHRVSQALRVLGLAPFDVNDDALLPKAGACGVCPKQTASQRDLFDASLGGGAKDLKKARCTDIGCWQSKVRAHLRSSVAAIKKEHPDALFIQQGAGQRHEVVQRVDEHDPAWLKTVGCERVVPSHEYAIGKKGDDGATPAIPLYGSKAGTLTWIVTHNAKRAADKRKAAGKTKGEPKQEPTLEQRLERHEQRVLAAYIDSVREELLAARPRGFDLSAASALVMTLGSGPIMPCRAFDDKPFVVTDETRDEWLAALWTGIRERVFVALSRTPHHDLHATASAATWIALRCGLDVEAHDRKAREDVPMSKALARDVEGAKPAAKPGKAKAAKKAAKP